ncbi:hypothetical protein [Cellulomonas fimi]|uniref:Uncharacterized protein n=1 Tax=Cellulomonas fimi TaxID=1708 RepID=A0A7Y0LX22_CELFI|nr:hypothetical protein [Cellulomonas fimi]NMR19461.1 hypothetical protein [Cellulomonas fimi]
MASPYATPLPPPRVCGASLELRHLGDASELDLVVRADPAAPGTTIGTRAVCRAVQRARTQRVTRVVIAVDDADPSSGVVLEALRATVGHDADAIAMRRAGSSVMVTVDVRSR